MKLDGFDPMGTYRDLLDPNKHQGTLFGEVNTKFGQNSGSSSNFGFFCPKWPT